MKKLAIATVVAAGLVASVAPAIADETATPIASPNPTHITKPLSEYRQARIAYKAELELYVANRKATMTEYKATLESFKTAFTTYAQARKAINEVFKNEVTLAQALTDEAAKKAALVAAKAKRDKAIADLGTAPVAPKKPELGAKPTPPVKPAPKASKTTTP